MPPVESDKNDTIELPAIKRSSSVKSLGVHSHKDEEKAISFWRAVRIPVQTTFHFIFILFG